MTPIIAIDPGKNGGLAFRTKDGEVRAEKMPATPVDVCDMIRSFRAEEGAACRAVIERVGGMPGNGGSRMFNFGYGVGYLHAVLYLLGVPTETVPPQKWMKALSLGTKGKRSDTEWKNALKSDAQRRYPNIDVTPKTADALLILAYATSGAER